MPDMNIPPTGGPSSQPAGWSPVLSDLTEVISDTYQVTDLSKLSSFLAQVQSYMADISSSSGQFSPITNERLSSLCATYNSFCANPQDVSFNQLMRFAGNANFVLGTMSILPPAQKNSAQGTSGSGPTNDLITCITDAYQVMDASQIPSFLAELQSAMTDLANSSGSQFPPETNLRIKDLCNQYSQLLANPQQVSFNQLMQFVGDANFLLGTIT